MVDASVIGTMSTMLSGLVSAILIITAVAEWITRGWIRKKVRAWLGLHKIYADSQNTQVFLQDFGESHNGLIDFIATEHDVPPSERPPKVNVVRYSQLIDNGDVSAGYFIIGDAQGVPRPDQDDDDRHE